MGFFNKFLKKTRGMRTEQIQAQNIASGQGRMVDGKYVAYSADDKEHNNLADQNKNADYLDISIGSQLSKYYGEGSSSLLERFAKQRPDRNERKKTLLGEFTVLGV